MGAPDNARRITNVANGTAPTDAATFAQIISLQAQIEELRRQCLPAQTVRASAE
jgi:hypothetical protein